MTTKAEFDSYVAGFKLGNHAMISEAQFDAVLAKVEDLVASLTASTAPAPVTVEQPIAVVEAPVEPVAVDAPVAPIVEAAPIQDKPVAEDPAIDEAPVDESVAVDVIEPTPIDDAVVA